MLLGEPGSACDIVGREPPRGRHVRWRGDSLHCRQHARHEHALRDGRAREEPERLVALEDQGPLRMHGELVEGRDHTVLTLTRSLIGPASPVAAADAQAVIDDTEDIKATGRRLAAALHGLVAHRRASSHRRPYRAAKPR